MGTPELDRPTRRGRVARRVVLGFLVSAIAPLVLMATISFLEVRKQLDRQAWERLHWLTKSHSLQLYDRIQSLSELLDERLADGGSVSGTRGPVVWRIEPRGDTPPDGDLRPLELQPSRRGLQTPARVIMRRSSGSSIITASIDAEYFWWGVSRAPTLPSATELVILDSQGRVVLTTVSEEELPSGPPPEGRQLVDLAGVTYRAWMRPLQLRPLAGMPTLRVLMVARRDELSSTFARFRHWFPAMSVSVLLVIALLSSVQVRRTLVPLDTLRAATRRLAERDYSARAQVHTGDELEDLARSFNGMAGQIQGHLGAIATESDIDRAILSSLDADEIASVLARRLTGFVSCLDALVLLFDSRGGTPRIFPPPRDSSAAPRLDPEELEVIASQCRRMSSNEILQLESPLRARHRLGLEVSVLVSVVRLDGELVAALLLETERESAGAIHDHLPRITQRAAIAFANARLVRDLDELSTGTLQALGRAVDAKSSWTMGHSERVATLSRRLGAQLGLESKDLDVLYHAGLVHDIGKIGVPASVLDKAGRLTAEELELMKRHVEIGARIIEPIATLRSVLPIVLQHHERLNGSGYPNGLAGEEIELGARIAAVADSYDAITSPRPYRSGEPPTVALQRIQEDSETLFDASVVSALEEVLARDGVLGRARIIA